MCQRAKFYFCVFFGENAEFVDYLTSEGANHFLQEMFLKEQQHVNAWQLMFYFVIIIVYLVCLYFFLTKTYFLFIDWDHFTEMLSLEDQRRALK